MANSGRKINYSLRPAKSIERKMMRDALLRLVSFGNLSDYQYIGFGSKYFTDFTLFHKSLHVNKMISIENDVSNKERYNFNKPFGCIHMEFGNSSDILPKLNYSSRTICWLDYDKELKNPMLEDTATLAQNLSSGSVIIISFNSTPYNRAQLMEELGSEEDNLYRVKFEEEFGASNVPKSFEERGASNWTNHTICLRDMINNKVQDTLSIRNAAAPPGQKLFFEQLFFFNYEDGAKMTTVGFIIYSEEEADTLHKCRFGELDFIRGSSIPFKLKVPNLTIKEIKELLSRMPRHDDTINELPQNVFSFSDVEIFSEYYKYFPNFQDIENV